MRLSVMIVLLSLALPGVASAQWGTPPESKSRVLAHPDGTTVAAARPLPVAEQAGSVLALAVGAVTTAVQAVGTTLSGIVAAGRAKVDPIAGQVGIAGGAGAASATTIRTVTASDSPELTLLDEIRVFLSTLAGASTGALLNIAGTVTADQGLAGLSPWLVEVDTLPSLDGTEVDLELAGVAVTGGAQDTGTGVVPVIAASRSTGACARVEVLDDAETAVLAAAAGRTYLLIQVEYGEQDGPIRCALGAASTGGIQLLGASAATATGDSLDLTGYSGAVSCRSEDAGSDHVHVRVCSY